MNEKTARSQVNRSFADYHVPMQMDMPEFDVQFINKPDPHISMLGGRGVNELAGVGVSAAIANAVFNANPNL